MKNLPKRYIIILLCSLSVIISYAGRIQVVHLIGCLNCILDRSNISIAIIPMSEELQLSKERQGAVLSSFFYGYLMTQILGGYLSFKFGGKNVLAVAAILWSLFTSLTPVASDMGLAALIACRIALGLGEGLGFPGKIFVLRIACF